MKSLILVAVLASGSAALAQPVHYQAIVLPGLGGTLARGLAVNDRGEVAGQATRTGQTYEVAGAWVNGQVIDLGGSGFSLSGATGVTAGGMVVGYLDTLGARAVQATPPGPVTMIPQLQGSVSHAQAINANLDIVGSWNTDHPFVMRSGVVTPLPLVAGVQGVAYAISNTGVVAGYTDASASGGIAAVRWVNDQVQPLAGGASVNVAYGVNDAGWAVGYVSGPPFTTYQASLWRTPTDRVNLGALYGDWNNIAYGINNHNQIVGTSAARGFIWQDGQMYDLNALVAAWSVPGWMVSDARAISEGGMIAGQASNGSQTRALLLMPVCSADFDHDGAVGTDADIEAFFACLGGSCCALCGTADFNGDGAAGTDADIESFFRALSGAAC
jgi:probable HAF family extracellular repeat protein